MAKRGSRYEWKCTTPIMVMPDGSERSFDTFTKEELADWWKRINIRCMKNIGYELVEKETENEKEKQ